MAPGAGHGPACPSACRSQTIKIRQGSPACTKDPQHCTGSCGAAANTPSEANKTAGLQSISGHQETVQEAMTLVEKGAALESNPQACLKPCARALFSLAYEPPYPGPGQLREAISRVRGCLATSSSPATCKNYPQLHPSPSARHFIALSPHIFQLWVKVQTPPCTGHMCCRPRRAEGSMAMEKAWRLLKVTVQPWHFHLSSQLREMLSHNFLYF